MNREYSRVENMQRLTKWAFHAQQLNLKDTDSIPQFTEMEVWITSIGQGVGSEVYGKQDDFRRPVLVLHKFNNNRFLGVPLTTSKIYDYPFSVETFVAGQYGKTMIDQSNSYDSRRLLKKIGMLDSPTFAIVRQLFA